MKNKFLIIASNYYKDITHNLINGSALAGVNFDSNVTVKSSSGDHIEVVLEKGQYKFQ